MHKAALPLTLAPIVILLGVLWFALMHVSTPAYGTTYNVIYGTRCNDWTLDRHKNAGNPTNSLCNRKDLRGTDARDKIVGFRGWDSVRGRGGADYFLMGAGMDQVYGDDGDDVSIDRVGGHDHEFMNGGDDRVNVADFKNEQGHMEDVHGGPGYDVCALDNDPGDAVSSCEKVTVLNNDGTSITFDPRKNVPPGVRVDVGGTK